MADIDKIKLPNGSEYDIKDNVSGYITAKTTLAGYGITDAKIENGTITLGSNSITPPEIFKVHIGYNINSGEYFPITTFAQVETAFNAGKLITGVVDYGQYEVVNGDLTNNFITEYTRDLCFLGNDNHNVASDTCISTRYVFSHINIYESNWLILSRNNSDGEIIEYSYADALNENHVLDNYIKEEYDYYNSAGTIHTHAGIFPYVSSTAGSISLNASYSGSTSKSMSLSVGSTNGIEMYDVGAEVTFIKVAPYQNNTPTVEIHLLKNPTDNYDAANKKYVDDSIPTIPTNVSAFTNDAGYLTSETYTGTVTSVQVAATSPVQSSTSTASSTTLSTTISLADAYGDTKNPYGSKTKNYVLAAPSDAAGAPSFRALVKGDLPTLTASDVGALPSSTSIPSKTSDLNNDSGFITSSSLSSYLPKTAGSSDPITSDLYIKDTGVCITDANNNITGWFRVLSDGSLRLATVQNSSSVSGLGVDTTGATRIFSNGTSIYLRPNGYSSTTGQAYIDTDGFVKFTRSSTTLSGKISGKTSDFTAYRAGNVVWGHFGVGDGTALSTFTSGTSIGTLPSEYRPVQQMRFYGSGRTSGAWASATYYPLIVVISATGDVAITGNQTNLRTCQYLSADFCFGV